MEEYDCQEAHGKGTLHTALILTSLTDYRQCFVVVRARDKAKDDEKGSKEP